MSGGGKSTDIKWVSGGQRLDAGARVTADGGGFFLSGQKRLKWAVVAQACACIKRTLGSRPVSALRGVGIISR